MTYLQQWANSEEYRDIKAGHYRRSSAEESVEEVPSSSDAEEVEALQRQIEQLQREINRIKGQ
ncbi:hypothetical protein [Phormidium sp. CCY1219]|uniref:hypothetical protein n=1 Tax=Phormidium sp. CCY1219 TaxID=2886104 RepID=UPI003FA6C72B